MKNHTDIEPILSIVIPIFCNAVNIANLCDVLSSDKGDSVNWIVVHDCPVDINCQLISHVKNEFKNINLLQGNFQNIGKARNYGLSNVTTDFVIFWDSDDRPELTETLRVLDSLKLENPDLIICNYSTYQRKTNQITRNRNQTGNLVVDYVQLGIEPAFWRCIIKTEKARQSKFLEQSIGEDQYFLLLAASKSKDVRFVNSYIYTYTIGSPEQVTARSPDLKYVVEAHSKIAEIRGFKFTKLLQKTMLAQLKTTALKCYFQKRSEYRFRTFLNLLKLSEFPFILLVVMWKIRKHVSNEK